MDRAIELQNMLVRQAAIKPVVIWPQMTAYAVIVLGSSAVMALVLSHVVKTMPISGQPLYFVGGFAAWVVIVSVARMLLVTPVRRAQEARRLNLCAIASSLDESRMTADQPKTDTNGDLH